MKLETKVWLFLGGVVAVAIGYILYYYFFHHLPMMRHGMEVN